jgi:hypothetical protein
MSEIRANSITDAAGTGAPNFPNGMEVAGAIGIGGANYGTTGQVLTSGGAGAAPSWAAPPDAGIGVGQTWQNVGGSRALYTSYQNTTGKPIFVSVGWISAQTGVLEVSNDGSTWISVGTTAGFGNIGDYKTAHAVVPNGVYYRASGTGASGLYWSELR